MTHVSLKLPHYKVSSFDTNLFFISKLPCCQFDLYLFSDQIPFPALVFYNGIQTFDSQIDLKEQVMEGSKAPITIKLAQVKFIYLLETGLTVVVVI